MAYSTLPTIPLVILGIIDPILCVYGVFTCFKDPFAYFASYSPVHPLHDFPPQAHMMSLMMGNIYILLAALALICCFSSSAATAKWYNVACAVVELGFLYSMYAAVGPAVFWNPSVWNEMLGGYIVMNAFICVVRLSTVLGVFGPIGGAEGQKKKRN